MGRVFVLSKGGQVFRRVVPKYWQRCVLYVLGECKVVTVSFRDVVKGWLSGLNASQAPPSWGFPATFSAALDNMAKIYIAM